jgi:hypothetical protein
VLKLIEKADEKTAEKMLFFWHGKEFLFQQLIVSIKDCDETNIDNLEEFITKFEFKKEVKS